jgi:hypothetical protein
MTLHKLSKVNVKTTGITCLMVPIIRGGHVSGVNVKIQAHTKLATAENIDLLLYLGNYLPINTVSYHTRPQRL